MLTARGDEADRVAGLEPHLGVDQRCGKRMVPRPQEPQRCWWPRLDYLAALRRARSPGPGGPDDQQRSRAVRRRRDPLHREHRFDLDRLGQRLRGRRPCRAREQAGAAHRRTRERPPTVPASRSGGSIEGPRPRVSPRRCPRTPVRSHCRCSTVAAGWQSATPRGARPTDWSPGARPKRREPTAPGDVCRHVSEEVPDPTLFG